MDFERVQAASHVLVEIVVDVKTLTITRIEELHLPLPGVRYLLIGRNCPDQTAQNNFIVLEDGRPVVFISLSGSGALCSFVLRRRPMFNTV